MRKVFYLFNLRFNVEIPLLVIQLTLKNNFIRVLMKTNEDVHDSLKNFYVCLLEVFFPIPFFHSPLEDGIFLVRKKYGNIFQFIIKIL